MSDQFLKISVLAEADARAIPMVGGGKVPFDCDQIVG